ncbi:MAG: zinc ribbon domain-containing protein [Deltaproteobacteria bacterium]|nr:zinc ribbon domain-containing protein [Deltaproteobacteria bacterium]
MTEPCPTCGTRLINNRCPRCIPLVRAEDEPEAEPSQADQTVRNLPRMAAPTTDADADAATGRPPSQRSSAGMRELSDPGKRQRSSAGMKELPDPGRRRAPGERSSAGMRELSDPGKPRKKAWSRGEDDEGAKGGEKVDKNRRDGWYELAENEKKADVAKAPTRDDGTPLPPRPLGPASRVDYALVVLLVGFGNIALFALGAPPGPSAIAACMAPLAVGFVSLVWMRGGRLLLFAVALLQIAAAGTRLMQAQGMASFSVAAAEIICAAAIIGVATAGSRGLLRAALAMAALASGAKVTVVHRHIPPANATAEAAQPRP